MEEEKEFQDKSFINNFAKEISKIVTNDIKNELEKDFIKRKEENDKYFWS